MTHATHNAIARAVGTRPVADAILQQVTRLLPKYFSSACEEPLQLELIETQECLNSTVYFIQVSGATFTTGVVVKAPFARNRQQPPGGGQSNGCPRLFPLANPDSKARLEHLTMVRMQRHFESLGDPRFGTVRVFDYLADERALVLEAVSSPTLAGLLARSGLLFRLADDIQWRAALGNAGAWLKEAHHLTPLEHTQPRQETRQKFVALVKEFAEFLAAHVGRAEYFRHLAETVQTKALAALPSALPLGMSHSDFAPNNIFVGPRGRVTVFDTVGRWQSPIYEDLSHFLLELKLAACRVYRPGWTKSPLASHYESEFLEGYFGPSVVPLTAVRLFELQALLERWARLAHGAKQAVGWRRVVKRLRLAWWSQILQRYADQLLKAIDSEVHTAQYTVFEEMSLAATGSG